MQSELLRNFLGGKGLKLTKERVTVLNEILSFRGHFETEHLYSRLRRAGRKVSRASVYRTLSLLIDGGLIEKVTRTEKGNVYEQTFGHSHHDHMICDSCGAIFEFYSEKMESLQNEICSKNRFRGVSHTLEIRGYCRICSHQDQ